jgi:hypothetical protein
MLNKQVLGILKESVALAREVQPIIEKQASCRKLARHVADSLVKYHLVDIEKHAQVEEALADPEYAYDLIVKLASQMPASQMGEPGDTYNGGLGQTADDRFLNWILS